MLLTVSPTLVCSETVFIIIVISILVYVKLLLTERNKSHKKFWGPAGNRTQNLLDASQVLLPLSHWCLWQRSRRYTIYRPQLNPADSLSARDFSGRKSLADRVVDLGGLTVWAHCPSEYYPPPQTNTYSYTAELGKTSYEKTFFFNFA